MREFVLVFAHPIQTAELSCEHLQPLADPTSPILTSSSTILESMPLLLTLSTSSTFLLPSLSPRRSTAILREDRICSSAEWSGLKVDLTAAEVATKATRLLDLSSVDLSQTWGSQMAVLDRVTEGSRSSVLLAERDRTADSREERRAARQRRPSASRRGSTGLAVRRSPLLSALPPSPLLRSTTLPSSAALGALHSTALPPTRLLLPTITFLKPHRATPPPTLIPVAPSLVRLVLARPLRTATAAAAPCSATDPERSLWAPSGLARGRVHRMRGGQHRSAMARSRVAAASGRRRSSSLLRAAISPSLHPVYTPSIVIGSCQFFPRFNLFLSITATPVVPPPRVDLLTLC